MTADSNPIEITANQRGFHQYGEPVRTTYGDTVEVYESSAAAAPHCWLRIDGATSGISDQKGRDMTAHLNLEQAVAIRDRLNAWIDEVPTRWDCETEARIAELTTRTVDEAGRERVREIVSGWVDGMQCHAVTDRIIDALGWTAAEPDPDADLKLKPGEVAQDWSKLLRRGVVATPAPVPPAPVVELDADELEGAAAIVRAHNDCAVDFPPITFSLYTNGAPPLLTIGSNRDGVSVLRIGGDQ